MKKHCFFFYFTFFIAQIVVAQSPGLLSIRNYGKEHANGIIGEFVQFLALPNLTKDTVNIQKNTAFIIDMMNKRGIQKVQLLNGITPGIPPAVYGEVMVPGAK